jgi:hypothetical protein
MNLMKPIAITLLLATLTITFANKAIIYIPYETEIR